MRQEHRLLGTLFVTQSLFSAALISIIALLSIIATDLSGSQSLAGLPNSIITFGRAVFALPMGVALERFGRRNGHAAGYFIVLMGAVVGILAVTNRSFPLLIVGAFLLGVGRSGLEQVRYTAAIMFAENRRATMMGIIVFAGTVGSVGGPLLVSTASDVAETLSLAPRAGGWLLGAIFSGIAGLIVFVFLRPDPQVLGDRISAEIEAEKRRTQVDYVPPSNRTNREIFAAPLVQLALFSMLIGQLVMVAIMTITPLHMSVHGYNDDAVPIVIAAHTLGMFGISPFTGWLADRFGRINLILAGAVILILSAVLAPLSTAMPVLIIALFLLGLGWNFCFIGGSTLLSDVISTTERGRIQGASDSMIAFAAGMGSLGSGVLFDIGGYVMVTVLGLGLTIILTGLIGRLSPAPTPVGVPS